MVDDSLTACICGILLLKAVAGSVVVFFVSFDKQRYFGSWDKRGFIALSYTARKPRSEGTSPGSRVFGLAVFPISSGVSTSVTKDTPEK